MQKVVPISREQKLTFSYLRLFPAVAFPMPLGTEEHTRETIKPKKNDAAALNENYGS
jgi:hypothetical protein